MRAGYYKLVGKTAVAAGDLSEWGTGIGSPEWTVAKTDISADILVSTVFLGLDHNFGEGLPLLFETVIFGGLHDQDMWRYSTWDEAEEGHAEAVKLARRGNLRVVGED